MRRVLILAAAFVLAWTTVAAAADMKIAIVNMQAIASQSEAAQEAQKKMKATFGPRCPPKPRRTRRWSSSA